MRGRIVLFVILAIVTALAGVYLGRSTTTPTAIGEPATTPPLDSSVGSTQRRDSGTGPSRSPTASSHTADSPDNHANRDRDRTQPRQQPPPPPASQQKPNTDPVRFGTPTTTPSGNSVITDLSDDRRAFSLAFSDRVVEVREGSTRDATRSFALTLPLTDGAKGDTLWIHVLGFAFTDKHATARLTLRLNGQVRVADIPAGWDEGKDIVQTLRVPAIPATTYRLSGVFEVHQDPDTGGNAILNIASIETGIG